MHRRPFWLASSAFLVESREKPKQKGSELGATKEAFEKILNGVVVVQERDVEPMLHNAGGEHFVEH